MRRSEHLSLDQLLSDPLIRMVMSSDAVEETDIRRLMQSVGRPRRVARDRCAAVFGRLSPTFC